MRPVRRLLSSWSLGAGMKTKRLISTVILFVSLWLTGCASLHPSSLDNPAYEDKRPETRTTTPEEEGALVLLYWAVYIAGSAFGGK